MLIKFLVAHNTCDFFGKDVNDFFGKDVNDFFGKDVNDFFGKDVNHITVGLAAFV